MATRRWLGRAEAVKQKSTVTVSGTWVTGETGTLTIGGADLVLTVGTTVTTADIATAIKEGETTVEQAFSPPEEPGTAAQPATAKPQVSDEDLALRDRVRQLVKAQGGNEAAANMMIGLNAGRLQELIASMEAQAEQPQEATSPTPAAATAGTSMPATETNRTTRGRVTPSGTPDKHVASPTPATDLNW